MTTRVLTLFGGASNVMTTSVTTIAFFVKLMSTLKAIKASLKGHMINRILHSWPISYEMTTCVISSIYHDRKSTFLISIAIM